MSGIVTLELDRETVRTAAAKARLGVSEQVRERLLISNAVSSAIREYLEEQSSLLTADGRAADIRFGELLDVNDFCINNWYVEVRALTNVAEIGLSVPTVPLMVGFLSHFYVCAKVDIALSKIDLYGFATPEELALAELTTNGLMAYLPIDRLKPISDLTQLLSEPRRLDPRSLEVFDDWQERATHLSASIEKLLLKETFSTVQVERLAAKLHDEVLRMYAEVAPPTGFEPLFSKLNDRFNLNEPVRSRPESPLAFLNSQEEKVQASASTTLRKFFRDQLNVVKRISLYRHLVESKDAFDKHRQTKEVLDHVTAGKAQSSPRRRDHVRRVKQTHADASEKIPIPPPIRDPQEKQELSEWFADFEKLGTENVLTSPDFEESTGETSDLSVKNLRQCNFQSEYRSGEDDLVNDFYRAAFGHSSEYWRAVGFFSSSALEAIGEPMGEFVFGLGTIKLVTSVVLQANDVEAIRKGAEIREVVSAALLEQIRNDFITPLGKGASILLKLLVAGTLEIRIAVPETGFGIFHEKLGIFLDTGGNCVAFSGSPNESKTAFEGNYECIDVFTSWNDHSRAESKKRHFERLWDNSAPGVTTMSFPDAAKKELIRVAKIDDAPLSPKDQAPTKLWKHQEEAIEAFLRKARGVLEMATGTGKTRTSLEICRHLFVNEDINTVIIAADGDDLLDQWYKELLEFVKALDFRIPVLRHKEREHFFLNKKAIILTSRYFLPPILYSLSETEGSKTLLIHDEVHRLGSPGNRENLLGLSDNIRFRLGLSATPDRKYDEKGNDFIRDNIGPVIYSFELADAIRTKILSPFDYFPLEYIPDENDRYRLQQVHKMAAARKKAGQPMTQEQIWTELAKVYKTSKAKLPIFERFLENHHDILRRCIIFVETREYGDEVLSIVHKYRPDFHVYYANEDSEVLRLFANGSIECLITCHRLSEGIDIHSLETVILFSSDRARLETIQRIGRCLRKNPEDPAKRARVVDFIRLPGDGPPNQDQNTDMNRREWLSHLSEIEPEV